MWEKNITELGHKATVPEVARHPGPPLRKEGRHCRALVTTTSAPIVVCSLIPHSEPRKLGKKRMASGITTWNQSEKKKKPGMLGQGGTGVTVGPERKKSSFALPIALPGQVKDVIWANVLVGGPYACLNDLVYWSMAPCRPSQNSAELGTQSREERPMDGSPLKQMCPHPTSGR